jgi:hypothetical protein
VKYRRALLQVSDRGWLVLDHLHSSSPHQYRLHWLLALAAHNWSPDLQELKLHLPEGEYRLLIRTCPGRGTYSLVSADRDTPRGWVAPYYHQREPALSLSVTVQERSVCFCSWFSAERCELTVNGAELGITAAHWKVGIDSSAAADFLVQSVRLEGAVEDELVVQA